MEGIRLNLKDGSSRWTIDVINQQDGRMIAKLCEMRRRSSEYF